jgi:hypothetical protein
MKTLTKDNENYIPYGEEWKNELMHLSKVHIISLYRMVCMALKESENKLSELAGQESEDFPEIDFREQIANELTRDELIERLCEMHKHYTEMREEWFNVVQLRDQPDKVEVKTAEEIFNDTMVKSGNNWFLNYHPKVTRLIIQAMEEYAKISQQPLSDVCCHPWASVLGDGEMQPAKCLKCGKSLS